MPWTAGGDGGRGASQAYWNARTKLRSAWRDLFGEELSSTGSRGKEAFENALAEARTRLARRNADETALRRRLDVAAGGDMGAAILAAADLDDRAPNAVKAAILGVAARMAAGSPARVPLRDLLRAALDVLFRDGSTRRPNVGPNRHWPRLLSYLRELEDETDWSPEGRGLRLVNAGGRGPVARHPSDPASLAVAIDPDHL